jgi:hypothetical protein
VCVCVKEKKGRERLKKEEKVVRRIEKGNGS